MFVRMPIIACLGMLMLTQVHAAPTDAELKALRDGFADRAEKLIGLRAGNPPGISKKRPPLKPGRGAYTRHYGFSVLRYALNAAWLGEQEDEVNRQLTEYAQYYLDHPKGRDDRDSFYWSSDLLCRIVEFFGAKGTRAPGRLRPATEKLIQELMFAYCRNNSVRADAEFEKSQTWHVHESENHHVQGFSTCWQFARFLAREPAWRERTFDDGGTPEQHRVAWTEYAKEYCRERVRKGLFVEMANKGYNVMTLKGLYNFHDFAADPELRRLSAAVLDLYWATWAEEQLSGVRGGASSRVYQGPMSQQRSGDGIGRFADLYLGRGQHIAPKDTQYVVLTSSYRWPDVVMDMALDTPGRGVYEIRQRRMGLAQPGHHGNPDYRFVLGEGAGGILRYTYCSPEFVLGTAMIPSLPFEKWALIHSQNRWHGAIFAGHPDARIYPQCYAGKGNTYNQQWSVQSKGALIAQKLPTAKGAREMRVWFSRQGLTERIEREGWVFVVAGDAYAAVRAVRGKTTWVAAEPHGDWLSCADHWTPVIIELGRKANYPTYPTFQEAILANPLQVAETVLTYQTLAGTRLTLHADHSKVPEINGVPVDYAPAKVFDSPFIQSAWDSGLVHIRKGKREHTIDVRRLAR